MNSERFKKIAQTSLMSALASVAYGDSVLSK